MNKRNIHVVPRDEYWAVKRSGDERAIKIVDTQKDAAALARRIAIKDRVDTKIHGEDGRIIGGDSYGNDPYPPKDRK